MSEQGSEKNLGFPQGATISCTFPFPREVLNLKRVPMVPFQIAQFIETKTTSTLTKFVPNQRHTMKQKSFVKRMAVIWCLSTTHKNRNLLNLSKGKFTDLKENYEDTRLHVSLGANRSPASVPHVLAIFVIWKMLGDGKNTPPLWQLAKTSFLLGFFQERTFVCPYHIEKCHVHVFKTGFSWTGVLQCG